MQGKKKIQQKMKKKSRERERDYILCVRRLCIRISDTYIS